MAQVCQLTVQILENTRNPIDAIGNSFETLFKKKKGIKNFVSTEMKFLIIELSNRYFCEYGSDLIFEGRGKKS